MFTVNTIQTSTHYDSLRLDQTLSTGFTLFKSMSNIIFLSVLSLKDIQFSVYFLFHIVSTRDGHRFQNYWFVFKILFEIVLVSKLNAKDV